MTLRKITSMTLVWSLIILILNSIVLYVVPEGRVAYWADWRFLGLTKSQWGEQHTTVGFLFLFAGLLHIYYNWKPIMAYMKNKAKEFKFFTGASNVGLALTIIFIVGTFFHIPPMSTILNISEHFKDAASEKYGEPPYGHAEASSLKMFTKRDALDFEISLKLLADAGITVDDPKQTIKEIAANNNLAPQQIYETIKPARMEEEQPVSPDAPKPGWGKKKLSDVCQEHGLNIEEVIEQLAQKEITATKEATIKEIGAENNLDPMGVFEALHEIVNAEK